MVCNQGLYEPRYDEGLWYDEALWYDEGLWYVCVAGHPDAVLGLPAGGAAGLCADHQGPGARPSYPPHPQPLPPSALVAQHRRDLPSLTY